MRNILKHLLPSAVLLTLMNTAAFAQSFRCGADGNDLNDVLDSRINQSSEYCQSITIGIAFLLQSECDSALSYFKAANAISPGESLSRLIVQVEGDIKSNPAKTEAAPATPSGSASPGGTTQSENPASKTKTVDGASEGESAVADVVSETAVNKPDAEKSFSEQELDEFKAKGLQKVKRLTDYLNILSQKSTGSSAAMTTVNSAMDLFDGEDHVVEVSSLNRPDKSRFPVRTYLNRLRMLNYSKVEITGAAFTYVSSFRKGPDGNYYGVARFRQTFTGYVENRPTYSDVTTKTVAVVLKPYQKAEEGVSVRNWDVFLGDITVAQTEEK